MTERTEKQAVLVVVHPGSCCGSAKYNLGRLEADASRDGIELLLDGWKGGVLILDGELSDELPSYPRFKAALEGALARAAAAGLIAARRDADDPLQGEVATSLVTELALDPATTRFVLTGAWWEPADGGGCVGDVLDTLVQLGFAAQVSEHVMELDAASDDDAEDDDDVHCLAGQIDLGSSRFSERAELQGY